MPLGILSCFVFLDFHRDDVMQRSVWFFTRGCFHMKSSEFQIHFQTQKPFSMSFSTGDNVK